MELKLTGVLQTPNEGDKFNIAVVQEDPALNEYFSFLTKSYISGNVTSISRFYDFDTNTKKFDLVIIDLPDQMGHAQLLFKRHTQSRTETRFLFLTGNLNNDSTVLTAPNAEFLEKPFMQQDFMSTLSQFFKNEHRQTEKYIPVSIHMLFRMNLIEVPLFLRIGVEKFIKVAHKNIFFDSKTFEKYASKGVTEFFIQEGSAPEFIHRYSKSLLAEDAWRRAGSFEKSITVNTEVLRTFSQKIGWGEELIELSRLNTAKAMSLAKKSRNFQKVVHSFQKIEKFGFSERATMMVLVTTGLAQALRKSKGDQIQRLTMASLFHDMTLSDLQFEKQEKLLEQLHSNQKSIATDSQNFMNHPMMAAELVRSWSFSPAGTDRIILEHHERPEGNGFPYQKTATELGMDTAIFITAMDFVSYYINHYSDFKSDKYLASRKNTLKEGAFDEILRALERMFVSSKETSTVS